MIKLSRPVRCIHRSRSTDLAQVDGKKKGHFSEILMDSFVWVVVLDGANVRTSRTRTEELESVPSGSAGFQIDLLSSWDGMAINNSQLCHTPGPEWGVIGWVFYGLRADPNK